MPALFAACLASAPAAADNNWRFNAVPYVWASGMEGRASHDALPRNIIISAPPRKILRNLDIAAMAAFEGRKGRCGFLVDGLYARLSSDARVPMVGLPVSLGSTTFTFMVAPQYRIVEDFAGSLDLIAGVRYWSIKSRISYQAPPGMPLPPPIPPAYSAEEQASWVDAMVGAKAMVRLTPALSLNAHGMLGAGGSSLSSDALVAAGVNLNQSTSLLAGYRHMSYNYRKDGFSMNNALHGPALGLSIRF